MSKFKPLLADDVDFDKLDWTNVWGSVKFDGIRAFVINGEVVSRNLKPIRNQYVQYLFGRPQYEGLDGELIVGDPRAKDCYNVTNSGVMSRDGEPEVRFFGIDHIGEPTKEYWQRYDKVRSMKNFLAHYEVVAQFPIESMAQLLDTEASILNEGHEGMMLRAYRGPRSFYKFGRSTAKEGTLLKLKRFSDKEAEIIGFEEEMANLNEATVDELGRTKRSAHQANKVGKGRLGALVCRTPEGVQFNIGTGFDAKTRSELWAARDTLPGQFVKYKSFDVGVVDAPRFPSFIGLRDPIDM